MLERLECLSHVMSIVAVTHNIDMNASFAKARLLTVVNNVDVRTRVSEGRLAPGLEQFPQKGTAH